MSFTLVRNISGTYDIEVDGLTTTLKVLTGWTRHAAHKFQICLPSDWIGLEVSPEAIDALIEEITVANPDLVPYLEALTVQEYLKFWAIDPASLPIFANNINVAHELRLISSIEQYAELIEQELEGLGWSLVVGDKFMIRDFEALRLEGTYMDYYPSGEPFQGEQQFLIVDHAGDRYVIILTYLPTQSQKYKDLFELVLETFNIVQ